MAVKYLAGNRIQGTDTERTATSLPSGTYAGWKLLGRSTRVSGDKLQVASLGNYPYYMILADVKCTSSDTLTPRFTINDDQTGSSGSSGKYSSRVSFNGEADDTHTFETNSHGLIQTLETSGEKGFIVNYLANLSGQEKLNITETIDTDAGTGNVGANRRSKVWKWSDNAVVTSIELINIGSGDFGTDDEIIVLGYDPTATNSENFWEELGSGDLSGGAGDTLSSGTISKKKYLWVQAYIENSNNVAYNVRFNGTTTPYTERYNVNGVVPDPNPITSGDAIFGMLSTAGSSSVGHPIFVNMFIINIEGDEKLVIGQSVGGSSGNNAPNCMNFAGKWTVTNAQISQVDIVNDIGSADYTTNSFIKVWGAD
jgi:hypothetical protein